MTVHRFDQYQRPVERLPIGTCMAIWAALDLVCIGLALAIIYAGLAILQFVGWL